MKKISLAIFIVFSSILNASMQSYLDDQINVNYEAPGSFKTQTRGLYSLGGMKVRYGVNANYRPVNVQMPRIKFGCGGIDAVWGGFSYLNEDYLINFAKGIISAAPAFAWQLALSTLDKDTQTIMDELQKMASSANNFNLDSCRASQKLFDYSKSFFEDGVQNSLSGGQSDDIVSKRNGSSLSIMTDYINTANSFLNDPIKSTDAVKKQVMLGSLLASALSKTSASGVSTDLLGEDPDGGSLIESLMRYMIGDLIGYKKGTSTEFEFDVVNYGATTSPEIDKFINGGEINFIHLETQADDLGEPIVHSGTMNFDGIKKIFSLKISSIVTNMRAGLTLSEAERGFINALPVPIYRFLNTTVAGNISNTDILSDYLALAESKALLDYIISSTANSIRTEIAGNGKTELDMRSKILKNCIVVQDELNNEFAVFEKKFSQKTQLVAYYKGLEKSLLGNKQW